MADLIPILNQTAEEAFYSFRFKIIDQIYLYGVSSVSLVGFIFSLFCVWIIFAKKDFDRQPIFLFYKILSLNSFLQNFFGIWYSLCYPNWFLSFRLQSVCVNYVILFIPFHILFHNYAILIEVGLLWELMKLFSQTVKKYYKLEPKNVVIILLVLSIFIGAMGSFLNDSNEFVWLNYERTENSSVISKQTFLFFGPSKFAMTKIGSIYFIAYSLIVHVPLISLQLISNIVVILSMRKHYHNLNLQLQQDSIHNKRKERVNKRTSLMAFILCSFSLISRTVLVTGIVSVNINANFFASFTLSLSDIIVFFNSGCLFFVFFSFNKIFRNHVLKQFGFKTSNTDNPINNLQSQNM